jgi:hypothetical protein
MPRRSLSIEEMPTEVGGNRKEMLMSEKVWLITGALVSVRR